MSRKEAISKHMSILLITVLFIWTQNIHTDEVWKGTNTRMQTMVMLGLWYHGCP